MIENMLEAIANNLCNTCRDCGMVCSVDHADVRSILILLGLNSIKKCPFHGLFTCSAVNPSDWYGVIKNHPNPINEDTFVDDVNRIVAKLRWCPGCFGFFLPEREDQFLCEYCQQRWGDKSKEEVLHETFFSTY